MDACLYVANRGTRRLMFRFPQGLHDLAAVKPYCREGFIEFTRPAAHQILSIDLNEENGSGWVEAKGFLSGLVQLRNDVLDGDWRCLYLAWLKVVTSDDPEDAAAEQEPPVPAGLCPALKHKLRGILRTSPSPKDPPSPPVRELLRSARRLIEPEAQRQREEAEKRRMKISSNLPNGRRRLGKK